MPDCQFLKKCPFFHDYLKNMPSASDTLKKMYCQWRYKYCARYRVGIQLGRDKIPNDLFPGDTARADKLLLDGNSA